MLEKREVPAASRMETQPDYSLPNVAQNTEPSRNRYVFGRMPSRLRSFVRIAFIVASFSSISTGSERSSP